MLIIKTLHRQFLKLNSFSQTAFYLGLFLMLNLYIIGVIALIASSYLKDPQYALLVYKGALETAPVTFNVGICMSMLGFVTIQKKDEPSDKDDA